MSIHMHREEVGRSAFWEPSVDDATSSRCASAASGRSGRLSSPASIEDEAGRQTGRAVLAQLVPSSDGTGHARTLTSVRPTLTSVRPTRSTDAGEGGAAADRRPLGQAGAGDRARRRADARRQRANERVIRQRQVHGMDREAGMATAEYAIATLAAVGFAALLVAVLSSGEIKGLLMSLITSALNFG